MKATLFILLQFLLITLSAQICPYPEESYYKYVISTLAHDSMEGRLPGTIHEKKAAGFIENEFRKTKCVPVKKKQYVFPFDFKTTIFFEIDSYNSLEIVPLISIFSYGKVP